jgi:uncharacterized membrane protein
MEICITLMNHSIFSGIFELLRTTIQLLSGYYTVQESQHRVDVRVQEPMSETVVVHDLDGAAVGTVDGTAVGRLLGAAVLGARVGTLLGADGLYSQAHDTFASGV